MNSYILLQPGLIKSPSIITETNIKIVYPPDERFYRIPFTGYVYNNNEHIDTIYIDITKQFTHLPYVNTYPMITKNGISLIKNDITGLMTCYKLPKNTVINEEWFKNNPNKFILLESSNNIIKLVMWSNKFNYIWCENFTSIEMLVLWTEKQIETKRDGSREYR